MKFLLLPQLSSLPCLANGWLLHMLLLDLKALHVLLDIMASVMLMLIHNSLLLVSHSAQALVWTQSPRVLIPSPKVLLFHTPDMPDMPLHTPPGDLESVRPKLTPLSTPLPQLTLTPPHTPSPLPTPLPQLTLTP